MKEVDECRTSKICNVCRGELASYRKRDGKLLFKAISVAQSVQAGHSPSTLWTETPILQNKDLRSRDVSSKFQQEEERKRRLG